MVMQSQSTAPKNACSITARGSDPGPPRKSRQVVMTAGGRVAGRAEAEDGRGAVPPGSRENEVPATAAAAGG